MKHNYASMLKPISEQIEPHRKDQRPVGVGGREVPLASGGSSGALEEKERILVGIRHG